MNADNRIISRSETILLCLLVAGTFFSRAQAVEVAPRISDREIIQSLAEIKAEFKAVDARFEAVDARFEQMEKQIDQRFEAVDQRFAQIDARLARIDQRIDMLTETILALFGSLMALIVTLFGYIIWDRRTAMRPLAERITVVERKIAAIPNEPARQQDARFPRLMDSLRAMARDDARIATLVEEYS